MGSLITTPEKSGSRTTVIEQLESRIQSRLGNQVRELRVLLDDKGVVLRGRSRTYYAKQLAQHTVMEAYAAPIVANEIEVQ